jgi:phosphatidylinositol glycan class A protein
LVYRKGIDLLAKLLPIICDQYPNIEFIIGGDGPKRTMLNEVVKQNRLENRVQLLGAVKYDQVRNILIKGDIFLNSSLTEGNNFILNNNIPFILILFQF